VVDTPTGQQVRASTEWPGRPGPGLIQPILANVGYDVRTGDNPTPDPGSTLVAARGDGRVTASFVYDGPGTSQNPITVDGRTFLGEGGGRYTLGNVLLYHAGIGSLVTEPGPFSFGPGVRAYSRTDARPGCGPYVYPPPINRNELVECPVWATPTDGTPTAPVLSPDGTTVYTRTTAGTLYALDATTGAIKWKATGLGNAGKPALDRDVLYVPTGDGRVVRFAAGGCVVATCAPLTGWSLDTGTGAPVTAVAVAGDVTYAVSGSTVYAGADCGHAGCAPLWSGPGKGSPVISNGQLYVTDGASTLIAYGLD
jgi:outer membrane protein assembly factor BamB